MIKTRTRTTGGQKWKQHIREKMQEVERMKSVKGIAVGFHDKNTASVASLLEFGFVDGSRLTPPRPFFRMFSDRMERGEWRVIVKRNSKLHKGYSMAFVKACGDDLVDALKAEMKRLKEPANRPATIKEKGHDDPLIGADGAKLIDAVEWWPVYR